MLAQRTTLFNTSGTSLARAAAKIAQEAGRDIIDLSAGEITSALPETIRDGAIDAIRRDINGYTDAIGLPTLRQALARKISLETSLAFGPDEIAVTSGAKQALFNAAMVLLDPGDEVLIPAPAWSTFSTQVMIAGAKPVFVDTRKNGYVPLIEDIEGALTARTRAIVVNTPSNPTGSVYGEDTLRAIAKLAISRNLWILFDECYGCFIHGGRYHHSIVSLVPEVRSRTVIVNAFSKSLALTGWRIGYLAAPAPVVAAVQALQSHTTSNPNVIAQHAVLRYLACGDPSADTRLAEQISAARQTGLACLAGLERVALAPAEGGFYFYLDLHDLLQAAGVAGGGTADKVAAILLDDAGVVVVSGTVFGDPMGLRLSYGVPADRLQVGCNRLVTCLNRWK